MYAEPPLSLYFDEQGKPRPIARKGGKPVLFFPSFGKMDDVLGRGGQLRSFEAVFSPLGCRRPAAQTLGPHDRPHRSGSGAKRGRNTTSACSSSEIGKTLEPRLRGKLHITVGSLDTFYLDGAVLRLADSLKRLGSDAEITIVPGADHGTILIGGVFSPRAAADDGGVQTAAAK